MWPYFSKMGTKSLNFLQALNPVFGMLIKKRGRTITSLTSHGIVLRNNDGIQPGLKVKRHLRLFSLSFTLILLSLTSKDQANRLLVLNNQNWVTLNRKVAFLSSLHVVENWNCGLGKATLSPVTLLLASLSYNLDILALDFKKTLGLWMHYFNLCMCSHDLLYCVLMYLYC